ncbi:MAG: LegC family aminotransferase [Elusimicrobia bacterium]|nr:LegC family aminotransferase [Elusimicrobiota bacterium]
MSFKAAAEPGVKSANGFVPLSEPYLNGREWEYVKECLDTGWVSSVGSFVDRFEAAVAERVGARHGVSCVNGTAALHMALLACDVRPDDEVIVSSLTFVAPVNAVRYVQAHPVFMDADYDTWQMDVKKVERFLREHCLVRDGACYNKTTSRRIRAILPVHILGLACDMEKIVTLAREFHLKVIEDACEGMGVTINARHVGSFGDVGVFSFNGNKIITCGGGGMCVTSDEDLTQRIRYLTTQAKDDPIEYIHHEIGYNYRLTNVLAAIGLAQLEQLDHFLEKKRDMARRYEQGLIIIEGVSLMPKINGVDSSYWLYTILLDDKFSFEERRRLMGQLNRLGFGCRPLWHPVNTLNPYAHELSFEVERTPDLYRRAISLPGSVTLTHEDQRRFMEALILLAGRLAG